MIESILREEEVGFWTSRACASNRVRSGRLDSCQEPQAGETPKPYGVADLGRCPGRSGVVLLVGSVGRFKVAGNGGFGSVGWASLSKDFRALWKCWP